MVVVMVILIFNMVYSYDNIKTVVCDVKDDDDCEAGDAIVKTLIDSVLNGSQYVDYIMKKAKGHKSEGERERERGFQTERKKRERSEWRRGRAG